MTKAKTKNVEQKLEEASNQVKFDKKEIDAAVEQIANGGIDFDEFEDKGVAFVNAVKIGVIDRHIARPINVFHPSIDKEVDLSTQMRHLSKATGTFLKDLQREREQNLLITIGKETYKVGADLKAAKWMIDDIRENGFLYESENKIAWFNPTVITSIKFGVV